MLKYSLNTSSKNFISLPFMIFTLFSTIIIQDSYLIQYSYANNSENKNPLSPSERRVEYALSPFIENYFAFNYTTSGGIAGIDNAISYNSNTNELLEHEHGKVKFKKQLSDSDVKNLEEIVQNESFFKVKKYYPPGEATDILNYTLTVVLDGNNKTVTWTDSSDGVPSGLSKITKEIENIASNRKIT